MICGLAIGGTICAPDALGQPNRLRHALVTLVEHVSLGAGSYEAVSRIAGHPKPDWQAGLVAVGIVAAVKEGSDAVSGADTKKKAAIHAASIALGGGIAAAVNH